MTDRKTNSDGQSDDLDDDEHCKKVRYSVMYESDEQRNMYEYEYRSNLWSRIISVNLSRAVKDCLRIYRIDYDINRIH